MLFQFKCSIETLWTFIANIRLHTLMSLHVFLKVTFGTEFLQTNVAREPSAFIVWHQQMYLQLANCSKAFRTVSTQERLCTSVNTNMTLQICDCHKLISTIKTRMWSYVAVYTPFMYPHLACCTKTFVTQWTLVWFISSMHSQVNG